jgi:hypothetical protein
MNRMAFTGHGSYKMTEDTKRKSQHWKSRHNMLTPEEEFTLGVYYQYLYKLTEATMGQPTPGNTTSRV